MRPILFAFAFLVTFTFFGLNGAYAQESMAEDVIIAATFGSPSDLTTIQLDFNQPLNEVLVKNLEKIATQQHYAWVVQPKEGAKTVIFKSEESYKGYGFHIYQIMKENNISLNARSVDATFSK